MTQILLTNDDGIEAPGLEALERMASKLGKVYVVAPAKEQSGAGRSITINHPLRYHEAGTNRYAVDGTPTDTMIMALTLLLDIRPDLVISGINNGSNLGENIYYSGTVAAAAEAAKHGIASIAVSVAAKKNINFTPAAKFTMHLGHLVLENGLPPGLSLNVNIPHPCYKNVCITRQSPHIARSLIGEDGELNGSKYYWVHEGSFRESPDHDTDYEAVQNGNISITPLHFRHTAHEIMGVLNEWCESLREVE